jgi:hypothetical protein
MSLIAPAITPSLVQVATTNDGTTRGSVPHQ